MESTTKKQDKKRNHEKNCKKIKRKCYLNNELYPPSHPDLCDTKNPKQKEIIDAPKKNPKQDLLQGNHTHSIKRFSTTPIVIKGKDVSIISNNEVSHTAHITITNNKDISSNYYAEFFTLIPKIQNNHVLKIETCQTESQNLDGNIKSKDVVSLCTMKDGKNASRNYLAQVFTPLPKKPNNDRSTLATLKNKFPGLNRNCNYEQITSLIITTYSKDASTNDLIVFLTSPLLRKLKNALLTIATLQNETQSIGSDCKYKQITPVNKLNIVLTGGKDLSGFFTSLPKKRYSMLALPLQNLSHQIIHGDSSYDQKTYYQYKVVDINCMLEFVKIFQNALKFITTKTNERSFYAKRVSTTILIDFSLNSYFKLQQHGKNVASDTAVHLTPKNALIYHNSKEIASNTNKIGNHISFHISMERCYMNFKISTSKYHLFSDDFFQVLKNINKTLSKKSVSNEHFLQSPALIYRNWHFQNIAQGYLLRNILKNFNVQTLNVMVKLYFVLITSDTPNLNIEIYFKLRNGIFMVYDEDLFNDFPSETIIWQDKHELILRESSKVNVAMEKPPQEKELKALSYMELRESSSEINTSTSENVTLNSEEKIIHTNMYFCDFRDNISQLSLKAESSDCSTAATDNQSIKTCLIRSLDDMIKTNEAYDSTKGVGDTNFHEPLNKDCHYYRDTLHLKSWLSKVLEDSKSIKATFLVPLLNFNFVNETIFDALSVETCMHITNEYLYHLSHQACNNSFFTYVRQTVGNFFI